MNSAVFKNSLYHFTNLNDYRTKSTWPTSFYDKQANYKIYVNGGISGYEAFAQRGKYTLVVEDKYSSKKVLVHEFGQQ